VSQVNLLPPEIRERQNIRQRTIVVAAIGGVVLLLILGFYFFQALQLSSAEDDLAAQEQTNNALQTQIAELQRYGDLQVELKSKQQLLATVYTNEVSWSGVLVDVSRVIPSDAQLTSFSGQVAAGTTPVEGEVAAETGVSPDLVGGLTFAGNVYQIDTLTQWLARLGQVRGWVNPYTTNATEQGARTRRYTFSSTVDLDREALTPRGRGEELPE